MLKYLPRSGMNFLLHIFNLSRSLHSFHSIWKTSSIIPIRKTGMSLNSLASFLHMLSLPGSQSFLKASFYRVYSSFWSLILSLSPPGQFPPWTTLYQIRPTLDQILFLAQSISDGFNKPRPGSRTILATLDFSKAFGSVWHPALFNKLISAGLPP